MRRLLTTIVMLLFYYSGAWANDYYYCASAVDPDRAIPHCEKQLDTAAAAAKSASSQTGGLGAKAVAQAAAEDDPGVGVPLDEVSKNFPKLDPLSGKMDDSMDNAVDRNYPISKKLRLGDLSGGVMREQIKEYYDEVAAERKNLSMLDASDWALQEITANARKLNTLGPSAWNTRPGLALVRDSAGALDRLFVLTTGLPLPKADEISTVEELEKAQTQLTGSYNRETYGGGGREAFGLVQFARGATPNAEMMPQAIIDNTANLLEFNQYQRDRLHYLERYGNRMLGSLVGFDDWWRASHPVEMYMYRARARAMDPGDITALNKFIANPKSMIDSTGKPWEEAKVRQRLDQKYQNGLYDAIRYGKFDFTYLAPQQ
jgi:hypothetical protein